MISPRYSDMELKQWQEACGNLQDFKSSKDSSSDAPRHGGARASMAKGQAEMKQSRTATAAKQSQSAKTDDWASECLFDCYNG